MATDLCSEEMSYITLQEHQSIVSDICNLSKVSDIDPLTLGSMRKSFFYHLFCITHQIYFSKDFQEIYI